MNILIMTRQFVCNRLFSNGKTDMAPPLRVRYSLYKEASNNKIRQIMLVPITMLVVMRHAHPPRSSDNCGFKPHIPSEQPPIITSSFPLFSVLIYLYSSPIFLSYLRENPLLLPVYLKCIPALRLVAPQDFSL